MIDDYRHKGLRNQLVSELIQKGIKDTKVLSAIASVPRHLFLDKAFEEWAYKDQAFPIDCEQTISQPYTVAMQSALLEITEKMRVLEIGLGSGYQASVLVEMGCKVYSIERFEHLYEKTTKRLTQIGYQQVRTFCGDGFLGLPRFAPFDRILITAAIPQVPECLFNQLKEGGILVAPVNYGLDQMMRKFIKSTSGIKQEDYGMFRFVPMLEGIVKK